MSDELVTWLRAQLEDDERVARTGQADGISQWIALEDGVVINADSWRIANATAEDDKREVAEHIARWDPARVLAEVDAKRRILDDFSWEAGQVRAIMFLALPYADRPGYREEWKPGVS